MSEIIREKGINSIAIPPLGCGNGGLDWRDVRPLIRSALAGLEGVNAIVYEPTSKYQNVAKRALVLRSSPRHARTGG
ncbi:macro domain-containing protein [Rhodophyticola sp.]|uniref:macro domain-containing protein n=1 Tax=Rhodophyticola sp. TaxID=2680032 RepID=UPI003D2CCD03